jgi:dimethylamine monooxygenase subunit A
VCFPNRWVLADKVGRHVTDVHAPVPGYADGLAARVDTVLDRLRPGQVLERRNWSMLDDPAMHQPVPGPRRVVDDPGSQVWARVERQTLVRLARTGAVVFTIRTRQRPLGELDDEDRRRLTALLSTVPADAAVYKGLGDLREPVLRWLGSAGDSPT